MGEASASPLFCLKIMMALESYHNRHECIRNTFIIKLSMRVIHESYDFQLCSYYITKVMSKLS